MTATAAVDAVKKTATVMTTAVDVAMTAASGSGCGEENRNRDNEGKTVADWR